MNLVQRIVAFHFAAFLWFVAFMAMGAAEGPNVWLAFASLLAGMALVLWGLRPKPD